LGFWVSKYRYHLATLLNKLEPNEAASFATKVNLLHLRLIAECIFHQNNNFRGVKMHIKKSSR
jgi:hypothetical protein